LQQRDFQKNREKEKESEQEKLSNESSLRERVSSQMSYFWVFEFEDGPKYLVLPFF
jgi:hypothetical protein